MSEDFDRESTRPRENPALPVPAIRRVTYACSPHACNPTEPSSAVSGATARVFDHLLETTGNLFTEAIYATRCSTCTCDAAVPVAPKPSKAQLTCHMPVLISPVFLRTFSWKAAATDIFVMPSFYALQAMTKGVG